MKIYSLDVLLSNFETVHCSLSSSDCCFLTCLQISQEAGKVVWYSQLFKNFPQFAVIHTVKGFSVVSEAEVDVSLELPCLFYDPKMLAIWSLVPLPFLNPACTPGSSQFMYCWSVAWRILSIILAGMWNECNRAVVWTFFGIVLLWDWNEKWLFPVLWPLLSFPNLLAYWVQHFHFQDLKFASSFRIWNSSTGILSPPLALFVVMLSKAHLTSHSRMSGSRWVITPLWLWKLRLF